MKKFVYLYLHNIVYFHKIPYVYTMLTMLIRIVFAGSLESAYSLISGSHEIWGKGGRDTLALL